MGEWPKEKILCVSDLKRLASLHGCYTNNKLLYFRYAVGMIATLANMQFI